MLNFLFELNDVPVLFGILTVNTVGIKAIFYIYESGLQREGCLSVFESQPVGPFPAITSIITMVFSLFLSRFLSVHHIEWLTQAMSDAQCHSHLIGRYLSLVLVNLLFLQHEKMEGHKKNMSVCTISHSRVLGASNVPLSTDPSVCKAIVEGNSAVK